mmetsp:Transcript_18160/g.20978  ORF Transcript_18160/g.20978 Transcript_18160/m.20978 type:complete len:139 (+) Transcript_18160:108-524(+)
MQATSNTLCLRSKARRRERGTNQQHAGSRGINSSSSSSKINNSTIISPTLESESSTKKQEEKNRSSSIAVAVTISITIISTVYDNHHFKCRQHPIHYAFVQKQGEEREERINNMQGAEESTAAVAAARSTTVPSYHRH